MRAPISLGTGTIPQHLVLALRSMRNIRTHKQKELVIDQGIIKGMGLVQQGISTELLLPSLLASKQEEGTYHLRLGMMDTRKEEVDMKGTHKVDTKDARKEENMEDMKGTRKEVDMKDMQGTRKEVDMKGIRKEEGEGDTKPLLLLLFPQKRVQKMRIY